MVLASVTLAMTASIMVKQWLQWFVYMDHTRLPTGCVSAIHRKETINSPVQALQKHMCGFVSVTTVVPEVPEPSDVCGDVRQLVELWSVEVDC